MSEWSKEVFSKNLRFYMEQRGINQKELAEIVGVSAPTINEWLKAKKFPRIDKIEILANYFGILKSDLIEKKVTEEAKKDNDTMADIIVHMRIDKEFLSLVEVLHRLDADKIAGVKQMLNAFVK